MDWKKLSLFIAAFGVAVALFGGFFIYAGSLNPDPQAFMPGLEPYRLARMRGFGAFVVLIGGAIIFVAVAVRVSAKKKPQQDGNQK